MLLTLPDPTPCGILISSPAAGWINILQWLGDVEHIYRWHERYNNAVVQVARESDVPLADVPGTRFLSYTHYGDLLCADGIHPNAKGHGVIEEVLEHLGVSLRRRGIIAG